MLFVSKNRERIRQYYKSNDSKSRLQGHHFVLVLTKCYLMLVFYRVIPNKINFPLKFHRSSFESTYHIRVREANQKTPKYSSKYKPSIHLANDSNASGPYFWNSKSSWKRYLEALPYLVAEYMKSFIFHYQLPLVKLVCRSKTLQSFPRNALYWYALNSLFSAMKQITSPLL